MLNRAEHRHLLIDSEKFGRKGLARVSDLADLNSIVVDKRPRGALMSALEAASFSEFAILAYRVVSAAEEITQRIDLPSPMEGLVDDSKDSGKEHVA